MFGSHRSPLLCASRLLVGVMALLCFYIPSLAQAGSAKEPGLLVVHSKGTARERAVATEAVTAEVTRVGWSLTPRIFALQETEELLKCLRVDRPWACSVKAVRDDAIRRLALVLLDPQMTPEGNPMTVVTIMALSEAKQDVVYSGRRYCQPCSPDSLAKLTSAAAREALEQMYPANGRAFLLVKSRPAGALVEVDGKQMGATDTSFEILPGRHRVVLKHPNHKPETRWIDAQEDKTAIVTVALKDVVVPGRPSRPGGPDEGPSLLLPKAAVITGAALMTGGALAIALDEDDSDGPPLNEGPQQFSNTAPLGVGLLIGGAVTAGLGGWLWWRASSKPASKRVSASLLIQSGGANFTFSKSF